MDDGFFLPLSDEVPEMALDDEVLTSLEAESGADREVYPSFFEGYKSTMRIVS